MSDDRQKILDRIAKCMRLAKSAEPHEAAAALRQAQKMMELHAVSDGELLGIDIKNVLVVDHYHYTRKTPLALSYLISLIKRAFNVDAVTEPLYVAGKTRGHYMLAVRYFGTTSACVMAEYAHHVIVRQLQAAWKQHLSADPFAGDMKGARTGFWVGWLQGVRSKVIEFADPTIKEQITKSIAIHYAGDLKDGVVNSMPVYNTSAGRAAASDFSIHRPMDGAKQRQLSN